MRPDRTVIVPSKLLGKRLREERARLRQTALEVARAVGISTGILWYLENDRTTKPMLHTLWKLADYYGVSIDYLVGRTDEREYHPRRKKVA